MPEHRNKLQSIMKKLMLLVAGVACVISTFAQADLLNMMDNETPSKPTPVYATFKSTRLVNLHTNENMKAKHLDFRIQHRFQPMDVNKNNVYGLYNMFGLDGASMRLGFEYGVTDKLMMGFGRSNLGKSYDLMAKYKILQQSRGKKAMPVSVNYFGNIGINTVEWTDKIRKNLFSSRLSYVNQIIVSRKFNDYVSIAISPTVVHHNLVQTKAQPNTTFALGMGGSFKLSRSVRFNVEYIPRLNGRDKAIDPVTLLPIMYYDAFAFGFDIETGGHVFQLHFTNAAGLIEQQFITRNETKLDFTTLRFGFNLSRVFSLEK